MHIKCMVIDGFKSYGQRTEINGFDPLFNAITGLNGSGKSNILDAICFLLGISNLSHVRATNLQELVYKNGQAGVIKATVTVTFDNTDKKQSPIGYEHYDEITITRQVVIGGRNKYLINGTTVQNSRVQDLFRSVQLNVNNPHFLIMQGRITKVLNMKPPEILSMIEEAAGTRMYESKKQQAQKTIEKKDAKLKEINDILSEEITPTLTRLKEERSQYLEYQKVQRELEHLTKLYVAHRFLQAQSSSERAKQQHEEGKAELTALQQRVTDSIAQTTQLQEQVTQLQLIRDTETGGRLQQREKALKEVERAEVKVAVALKNLKETINTERKKQGQVAKSLAVDDKALQQKQAEGAKLQGTFDAMRAAAAADAAAAAAAEERLQAVSSGMLNAEDGGENATLQDQLIKTKASIATANTETKQAEMRVRHTKEALKQKQAEMKQTEASYTQDSSLLQRMEKHVTNLETQLGQLGYDPTVVDSLEAERQGLNDQVLNLQEKVDGLLARYPQLCFNYQDPERNFDRQQVRGIVCKLFKMRDPATATALEVIAGGKLYNVVVNSESVGKQLLQRGHLQNRVTFIPLNKITSRPIDKNTINRAQQLVGPDNVQSALSLVDYDKNLTKAMEWVFGGAFVCKDMNTAKSVTFHQSIMRKCVTLEGDVVDPAGTLSGGSRKQGGSILSQLDAAWEFQDLLETKSQQLAELDGKLAQMQGNAARYEDVRRQLDLRSHEAALCRQRLHQGHHHQHQQDVIDLTATIEECLATMVRCKEAEKDGEAQAKQLQYNINNAKAVKQQQLKDATQHLEHCKDKANSSRQKWDAMQQEEEALKLEVGELAGSIETQQQQLTVSAEVLQQYDHQLEDTTTQHEQAKEEVKSAAAAVKEQKEMLSAQNKEINTKLAARDALVKAGDEATLQIQQLEHTLSKLRSEAREAEGKVARMLADYAWIAEDRKFFGQPNTGYDFEANDPVEAGRKISKLEETKTKLSKNVNMRAMNMLGKAEEQYNDLMRKKRIVENDKAKIETVIRELDEKKKEALRQAWEQVNKDFGSIFGMLLPGTRAKLQPPDGMDVLDGLEVKIAFGNIWKESLTELSGGQRSLVALSLILALLLFKPAPIYILDEVDAALDLSHTQNIGHMLRTHFRHSQFIVVSLKDGMFNNANVLFKTKFVDGNSTVTRHTQQPGNITRRK